MLLILAAVLITSIFTSINNGQDHGHLTDQRNEEGRNLGCSGNLLLIRVVKKLAWLLILFLHYHHLPPSYQDPTPEHQQRWWWWWSTCLYARDPPSNALLQNQPEQPSDFAKSETYWWVKEGNWTEMEDWKAAKQDGVTAKVMTVCLWGVNGSSSKTEKGAELLRLKSAIHSKVVSSLQGKDKYKRQYCENGAKIFCQISQPFEFRCKNDGCMCSLRK